MKGKSITRICRGQGRDENLAFRERLAVTLIDAAFCPLGQSAAVPMMSAWNNFRPEIDEHLREKDAGPGSAGCTNAEPVRR